jgi:hypothetical protein
MKFKTIYDKSVPTRNLITTISGIVTLLITLLVTFGVFTPEQAAGVTVQTNTLLTVIPEAVSAIAALILIFKAKDA